MKKITVILGVLLIIVSCKTKKTFTTTDSKDTIKTVKIVKITNPQLNNIVIDDPCDSLGNLKPFNYTFVSDKIKTSLKAINDTIYLEQNIDSIKDVWESEYRSSYKSKEELKVITERYIPKWAWYSLIYSILSSIWIFRKPLLRLINPVKM